MWATAVIGVFRHSDFEVLRVVPSIRRLFLRSLDGFRFRYRSASFEYRHCVQVTDATRHRFVECYDVMIHDFWCAAGARAVIVSHRRGPHETLSQKENVTT